MHGVVRRVLENHRRITNDLKEGFACSRPAREDHMLCFLQLTATGEGGSSGL